MKRRLVLGSTGIRITTAGVRRRRRGAGGARGGPGAQERRAAHVAGAAGAAGARVSPPGHVPAARSTGPGVRAGRLLFPAGDPLPPALAGLLLFSGGCTPARAPQVAGQRVAPEPAGRPRVESAPSGGRARSLAPSLRLLLLRRRRPSFPARFLRLGTRPRSVRGCQRGFSLYLLGERRRRGVARLAGGTAGRPNRSEEARPPREKVTEEAGGPGEAERGRGLAGPRPSPPLPRPRSRQGATSEPAGNWRGASRPRRLKAASAATCPGETPRRASISRSTPAASAPVARPPWPRPPSQPLTSSACARLLGRRRLWSPWPYFRVSDTDPGRRPGN